jgi:biotin carboxyl carrier protein
MEHAYRSGTRRIVVAVRPTAPRCFQVAVDGEPHAAESTLLDAGLLEIVIDDNVRIVAVERIGDSYHVAIDGQVYVLTPESADAAADHTGALAPPQIVAPMPGKVLQVLVRVGQAVAADEGLLVLEAMKMEHRITAEAPATVSAVHVADGQMVDGGTVLIELEYAER